MKRLVIRVILFVSIGAALLGGASWYLRGLNRALIGQKVFRLPSDIVTLVVGDSHAETAFDPRLLPGAANVAKSGENYFFTYYKLKLLLDKNPQVRNVILGFSYHNLALGYQDSFLFGEKLTSCDTYFYLLDEEGQSTLRRYNSGYMLNLLKTRFGLPLQLYKNDIMLKLLCRRELEPSDLNFFGGYRHSLKSNLDDKLIIGKIGKYYSDKDGAFTGVSPLMTSYLQRILALCERRKVQVVLVNSPLHPHYRELVPRPAVGGFNTLAQQLQARFSNVKFFDWSKMSLDPADFYDGDHVNSKGAEVVSAELGRYLQGEKSGGAQPVPATPALAAR